MAPTLDGTPRADGFRMPGEFEPHEGCWMIWPERPDNWRDGAAPAQQAFTAVATAIATSEPVTMAVSAAEFAHARAALPPSVRVVEISTDDAWVRDTGPTFVIDGRGGRRGVDWIFNAWGGHVDGLYSPWDLDDQVAQKICEFEADGRYRAPIIAEGGALHVDGEGTLLSTSECLPNAGRNPDLSIAELETRLRDHLGVEQVIWLPRGVFADETKGHVDNLLHYIAPGVICLTWTEDRSDPQYERSAEAYELLMNASDARSRRFEVHKLQQPGPLYMTAAEAAGVVAHPGTQPRRAGDRLAGSYCNFYIGNSSVIVPLLDPEYDTAALQTIQQLLPSRRVVGVPGGEILLGGGNIHCITQQVPRR